MARNFFRIFTENNPVMGSIKTFFIPEAKGLRPVVNKVEAMLIAAKIAGSIGILPCCALSDFFT